MVLPHGDLLGLVLSPEPTWAKRPSFHSPLSQHFLEVLCASTGGVTTGVQVTLCRSPVGQAGHVSSLMESRLAEVTIRNDSGVGHDTAMPRLLGEHRISEADASPSERFGSPYSAPGAGLSSCPVNGNESSC